MIGKDFLHDCAYIENEILDSEHGNGMRIVDNEYVPYKERTKEVLRELLDFVRIADWATNDTAKFVAKNYRYKYSQLPDLWKVYYPDIEKASSTFRSSAMMINGLLTSIFGTKIIDIFTNEKMDEIEDIHLILTHYKQTDIYVEDIMGVDALNMLVRLKAPVKSYAPSDCTKELYTIARMSKLFVTELLKECDPDKLAYIYSKMAQPTIVKGVLSKERMKLITEYLSFIEQIKTGEIEGLFNKAEQPTLTETTEETPQKVSQWTEVQQAIYNKYRDIEIDPDSFPTREVLAIFASATEEHLLQRLSKYDDSEVACTLQSLINGDSLATEAYRAEIENPTLLETEQDIEDDSFTEVETPQEQSSEEPSTIMTPNEDNTSNTETAGADTTQENKELGIWNF